MFTREGASLGTKTTVSATEHLHNCMETFLAGQNLILEKIASGADLAELLANLLRLIESQSGGMLCSILLLDEDGVHLRHGAAPSLPESYNKAIDGLIIGPNAGSCGAAAYFAKPVVVTDILTDALWDDYRDSAVKHGLRACWSTPILLHTGQVSGTFAMYYRVPRGPSPEEKRLTQTAAHIASLAIERQRAEQSLRESEERSRAILRAIPDSIFLLDSDYTYLDCQPRSSCQAKIPHDNLIGKNMRDVLPSELAEKFVRSFQKVSKSGAPQLVEYDRRVNGQMRYSEARVVFTSDRKFLVVVRDITERRLAEEALRNREKELSRSHAKIRELAGKLMSAQEEERRRISRELHDDLNQKVAALSIMISTITHQLALEESLKNQLEMVHTYSVEIADGIHRLSHELHPAVLEHVGLPAALRAYVAEFSRLEKIRVELTVPEAVEGIPHDAAVCLYRIAQESLRNIVKHSGVDHAEITLTMNDRAVCLHIVDYGSGFDLSSARNNGGLGLASMEERIRLVQGSFRISTQPGGGSKLLATIPLRK
jgi:PAS domain S-box-containing protein